MKRKRRRLEKDIAVQRIERLLHLADRLYVDEPRLAMKYGELARKIAKRSKVKIPRRWKWRYCKRCGSFLRPGINLIVRTRPDRMPHIVLKCLVCGGVYRRPYLREKGAEVR